MLQVGSVAKRRVLWKVSNAAELYGVFQKKKRKAVEVRVKTEEPCMTTFCLSSRRMRTGKMLQGKTVRTWRLHHSQTRFDRICRVVLCCEKKRHSHGGCAIQGSPAPSFDGVCGIVSCLT